MADDSVGTVVVERVDANTLRARMRAEGPRGLLGDLEKTISRGDPDYEWFERKLALQDSES